MRPPALLLHVPERALRQVAHAPQVHAHPAVPDRGPSAELGDGEAIGVDAGVVDHDVDGSEFRLDLVDRGVDRRRSRTSNDATISRTARRQDALDSRGGTLGVQVASPPPSHRAVRALRRGNAEALAGAGDRATVPVRSKSIDVRPGWTWVSVMVLSPW